LQRPRSALLWFVIVSLLQAPVGKDRADFTGGEFLVNLFYKHFTVSFAHTPFFCWAMATLLLKRRKPKPQRHALLLDVFPSGLGKGRSS
jgi:hypothetical protein